MRKILHYINKLKVQSKLHLFYFTAIFIPVMLIGTYLVYNSRSLLLDHYEELAYADNLRVKSLLLDMTSNIYHRAENLAGDPDLLRILGSDYFAIASA